MNIMFQLHSVLFCCHVLHVNHGETVRETVALASIQLSNGVGAHK
jgi:hypothetical protein